MLKLNTEVNSYSSKIEKGEQGLKNMRTMVEEAKAQVDFNKQATDYINKLVNQLDASQKDIEIKADLAKDAID